MGSRGLNGCKEATLRTMKHFHLIFVVLTCVVIQSAQGFNLFEFLQRNQHERRPAPRWPPPQQQPQLQYNYDKPLDNVIEQPAPTRAPSPQPPRYSYSRPNYEPYEQPEQPVAHYEAYEPEQPADIPVVVGSYNIPLKTTTTTTTTPPPHAPTQPSYYYEEIDIITAPPIGGHRHYGNTYEVQVGTNFNAGT